MILPKGSILKFNGTSLTEHNRAPVSVTVERIESTHRTAAGFLRKYVIADKRTVNTSWTDMPRETNKTVDGHWGGDAIEEFYNNNPGPFTLTIVNGDGTTKEFSVVFSRFDKSISKRGSYDFWDVNISLEEV